MQWRRGLLVKGVALLLIIAISGYADSPAMRYLPMFGLGVLMAVEFRRLSDYLQSCSRSRLTCLLVLALLLLDAHWLSGGRYALTAMAAAGAALLVALVAVWRPLQVMGEVRPLQWLGRISFSLYLVHEPVVVSTALLLDTTNPLWPLLLAVPAALVLAQVFNRFVELPAHRLSKRVGQLSRRWVDRARRPAAEVS
jgi:peptidoglycan/LPS O-acetylase OafA/YrhL